MGQQSRTGRGAQFALHAAAIDRNPSQQIGSCRCRYGHYTVRAAHCAASHMYRRDDHAVDAQKIHRVAHAGHVCDGIQRTDFMIMHVAHRTAMRLGLGLCDGIVDRAGVLLDCVRQVQTINDRRDMTGRCMVVMVSMFMCMIVMMAVFMIAMVMIVVVLMFMVMMVLMVMIIVVVMMVMLVIVIIVVVMMVFMFMIVMMMIMVVVLVLMRVRLVFLFPMYGHTHVRTRDAAGLSRFGSHLHAVQAQFLHFAQKCRLIVQ